jgi:hypothetical protein
MSPSKNNVHFPNQNFEPIARDSKRDRLLKQPAPAKTKGVPFHFGKSMFADDATCILSSQQELETLCATIFHHMHHFGLLMHAGTLDGNSNHQTKSKMETMFILACPMNQEDIDAATTDIVFALSTFLSLKNSNTWDLV